MLTWFLVALCLVVYGIASFFSWTIIAYSAESTLQARYDTYEDYVFGGLPDRLATLDGVAGMILGFVTGWLGIGGLLSWFATMVLVKLLSYPLYAIPFVLYKIGEKTGYFDPKDKHKYKPTSPFKR